MLPPYVSCNLGSIDLSRFVSNGKIDWKSLAETTRTGVSFLDGSVEAAFWPVDKIRERTRKYKNIGLGVMGWADMLLLLGIPYDSDEALELGGKVMKFINDTADEESRRLGKGKRKNTTLTSIAPTGSISLLAGASSGIEPLFGVVTMKNTYVGSFRSAHWVFEDIAKKRGFYSEELMEKIAKAGSVQDLDVPEDVKRLFKTAMEIDWKWHVKHQAAFQKYTDNAVSKTINLSNDATIEDVDKAYWMAYETGCKSITVYRDGSRQVQVMDAKTTLRDKCPNCDAILFMKDGKKECVTCGYKPSDDQSSLESPESEQKVTNGVSHLINGELKTARSVVLERPLKVNGATYRIATPLGTAFITVNQDDNGDPFEVFIMIGKAGSEVAALAEALGRLISTTLRFGNHLPARERAREIMMQLKGISGGRSVGFGPNKVRSLPDAVARAIGLHFGFNLHSSNEVTSDTSSNVEAYSADLVQAQVTNSSEVFKTGDICPSCGASALVYEEGCAKCHACGHSEC